jgi:hypothetical protein
MIPIFSLDQVRVAWIEIRGEGFVLYGFMMYSDLDTPLVEYMRRGLSELDYISGSECAIFVIESPSEKFIEHAKRAQHPWWRLFGEDVAPVAAAADGRRVPASGITQLLLENQNVVLMEVGDARPVSLRHLLEPDYSILYDREEVWRAVKHFGLKPDEIPCIVFFRDLDQGDLTVVDLRDIKTLSQATHTFRKFFSGGDFKRILNEARTYA